MGQWRYSTIQLESEVRVVARCNGIFGLAEFRVSEAARLNFARAKFRSSYYFVMSGNFLSLALALTCGMYSRQICYQAQSGKQVLILFYFIQTLIEA
jgi:hypothetical protein